MFAGPNGSGKSALKSYLPPELLGVYLNPDEIEAEIRRSEFLDPRSFGIESPAADLRAYLVESDFLKENGLEAVARRLQFVDGRLMFAGVAVNSYLVLVAVDFMRRRLLAQQTTFTFETVMSHDGKVTLLEDAQRAG